MSQPMPFPRPRARAEDTFAPGRPDTPGNLPKRVPGAALYGVPGARNAGPMEQPRLDWRPYPPHRSPGPRRAPDAERSPGPEDAPGSEGASGSPRGPWARLVAALRLRLRRR
ncbi:hypothetical protein [Cryptosporangium minutisporangium]|uniref:Uncharacterized protein n=1 Tax=Cryptosporangium minutisporangium TaxID=113569 RepID=A0ABP6T8L5_9ACTN